MNAPKLKLFAVHFTPLKNAVLGRSYSVYEIYAHFLKG